MTEYPCCICETPTTRGTLLRLSGEWIAIPLCPEHRDVVAHAVPEGTHIVEAKKLN